MKQDVCSIAFKIFCLAALMTGPATWSTAGSIRVNTVPAPAGKWRPFSDNSPWNTLITKAPLQKAGRFKGRIVHNSAVYMAFLNRFARSSTISTARWSKTLYFVDSSKTPGTNIKFSGEIDYDNGFLRRINPVPIPANAVSDPGDTGHYPPRVSDIIPDRDLADAEMCIVDLKTGHEYDFWHAARNPGGPWVTTTGLRTSINGDGLLTDPNNYYFALGTAMPILAGMILRNELAAGEIRHALAVSVPDTVNQRGFYVWPGLYTDGRARNSRAIPEGARLRLKWTEAQINAKFRNGQLSASGRVIALALRRYGAFNMDNGGTFHLTFYAQNFSDTSGNHNKQTGKWRGLLNMDAQGFANDVAMMRGSDFELVRFAYGRNFRFGEAVNDLNGDGKSDIFWRYTNGRNLVWLMDGSDPQIYGSSNSMNKTWSVVGIGDFNGDKKADILWRHRNGKNIVWFMNGKRKRSSAQIPRIGGGWSVAGVGDFNGDKKADILWRHRNGVNIIWFMNGKKRVKSGRLRRTSRGWSVAGVSDFNGDKKADILWRHRNGLSIIWLMNGAKRIRAGKLPRMSARWIVAGVGDFNRDKKSDILWRHANGANRISFMNGTKRLRLANPGSMNRKWFVKQVGDFNGDGMADIFWRDKRGSNFQWLMRGFRKMGAGDPGRLNAKWRVQP